MNALRDWFDRAQDIPEAQRRDWLAAHCADAEMRERVCQMLDAAARTDPLERSAAERLQRLDGDDASRAGLADWTGRQIGAFRLVELIGEGGTSVVFRAERIAMDFAQTVAVKLLRRGLFSDAEQHWFRRERRVLAQLEHPHIARLIDGGIADEGYPYLVMEYVDGLTLTAHCRTHAPTLRARLQLFVLVCRAVEAAHRALIVHRDIKPGNLLVTRDGTPKLLDFGIAKLLDDESAEPTRTGMGALTPEYAAPEQFVGGPITTATDVYALGVVLHELLVGRRPSDTERQRPSVVAAQLTDTTLLPNALRGDLDNILLKALSPEPDLRYASAGALADDLDRHLEGRPVLAHPPSRWYRTRKFVLRHRGSVALTALLVVGIASALALALWQGHKAQQEAQRADVVRDFLFSIFESAQDDLPRDVRPTVTDLTKLASTRLADDASLDDATRAQLYAALARVSAASSAYDPALAHYDAALRYFANAGDPLPRERLGVQLHRVDVLLRLARFDDAHAAIAPLHDEIRAVRDDVAIVGMTAEAVVAVRRSDLESAIAIATESATRAAEHFGESARTTLEARLTLGDIHCAAGQPRPCVDLLEPAIAAWSAAGLPESYAYATSVQNLGSGRFGVGDIAGAERSLREGLRLREKILSRPNEELASTARSLGSVLLQLERLDEAEALFTDAEQQFRAIFGDDHPQVVSSIDARGSLALQRRRIADANALYASATAICDRIDANSVPTCTRVWQNYAYSFQELGRFDEALQANARGLALRAEQVGEQHPSYANSLSGRAAILIELDRADEALTMIEHALGILDAAKMSESEAAGVMQGTRSRALHLLGRDAEALDALVRSESVAARSGPSSPTRRLRIATLRAEIFVGLGRIDEARTLATSTVNELAEHRSAVTPRRWDALVALSRGET